MKVVFTSHGWEDYGTWSADRKMLRTINRTIEEPWRDAGRGIGKPERLSSDLSGLWSRQITDERHLVYEVVDGTALAHLAQHPY